MSAGEPIEEKDDLYGASVIRAARVMGKAQGGEILASGRVRALTASAGEFAFDDRREVELTGLTGTHRMHLVEWDEPTTVSAY